jgi:hypothetical protein
MAASNVPPSSSHDADALSSLLNSPEIASLIADLDATRWTGRPGFPTRAMVGMFLVKSLNCFRPGLVPCGW